MMRMTVGIACRIESQEPSSPAKFAVALILVGAGFAILIWAAKMAEQGVQVSPMWLTVTYFLHTCGELCLSPVGLSAMTKLAPARIGGLMMDLPGRIARMVDAPVTHVVAREARTPSDMSFA